MARPEILIYSKRHSGLDSLAPFNFLTIMKIGNIIKVARKKIGLSQGQLADRCSITVTYLSLIENDKKEPTISLLRTIAENLKLPLPILLFLSLDDEDIPESKKEFFNIVKPSIDSMLQNLIEDAYTEG